MELTILIMIIIGIILGYITGYIAKSQGRSFVSWFIAGFLCFMVAFLYLLLSKPSDETLLSSGNYRKCPQCAEMVKVDAKICRYCGSELPEGELLETEVEKPLQITPEEDSETKKITLKAFKILGIVMVASLLIFVLWLSIVLGNFIPAGIISALFIMVILVIKSAKKSL